MTSLTNGIAIFASDTGSNALALIDYAQKINAPIRCLICDNPNAAIIKADINIPIIVIPYGESKKEHEAKIMEALNKYEVEWIFLAGYMRILSKDFIDHFSNNNHSRIINIHPSLLPHYKGLNAYEKSFFNDDQFSGVTIHYVDAGIDTGEIILQGRFDRDKNDKLDDYIHRGKSLEHILYPQVLERVTRFNY